MALINGNDYDHIDFTKNGVTTRHMLKDTLSRQMSGDLVKVQNEEPTSEGTKIWIKPSGDSEVQVPTYEEFEELSDKVDNADATIESLAVGAQPTVSVTEVDGHKRFSFGIPASNGIASITKTATDGVIDTYTIAMTDGTSTSFSVNNSDITPESMAEAIAIALQDYARIDGYYPDMTVGNAEQLNSSKYVENSEPYTFRTSGGSSDIGNREYLDAMVGGTLAWNQAVRDSASENSTDFAPIVTVTDAVEDAAGVKVKLEPVQDLYGYDAPWPAGGGKNLLSIDPSIGDRQINGLTIKVNRNASGDVTSVVANGTATLRSYITLGVYYFKSGTILNGCPSGGAVNTYSLAVDSTSIADRGNGYEITEDVPQGNLMIVIANGFVCNNLTFYPMVRLASETDATFAPYSNICPITGWDDVKVTRTGKNLFDNVWDIGAISNITGENTSGNNNTRSKNYIPVKGGQSIYFGWDVAATGSVYMLLMVYKADKSFSRYIGARINPFLYTLNDDECYIRFYLYNRTEPLVNPYIVYGTTATDFEPYAGNTYDITLPTEAGTVYGGTLDVSTGELVVDRVNVVVDDAALKRNPANWYDVDTSNNRNSFGIYFYWNDLWLTTVFPLPDTNKRLMAITDSFVNAGGLGVYNNDLAGYFYIHHAAPIYIGFRISSNDLADTSSADAVSASAMTYLHDHPVQLCYYIAEPQTHTITPTQIRTLLGENNVWADTGDLALTYTGTDEHLTLESGKKYLARINGTDSMLLGSGQEITAAKGADNVFDLTQMFGTAVADYVYGQGAAFFRKWFTNAVYPYNAGELRHVEGLQSHDMVGFNLFDKSTATDGKYINGLGTEISDSTRGHSAIIPVFPSTYYYCTGYAGQSYYAILWLDGNERPITDYSGASKSAPFTAKSPANARYAILNYHLALKDSVCFNLSHNNSRNGEYEPYEKHSYPLDSTVILRGIPKVGANGVYWDGDRYLPDGTVERRYGVVDLGTLTWGDNGNKCWVTNTIPDIKPVTDSPYTNRQQGVICTKYPADTQFAISGTAMTDKTWLRTATVFAVKDTSYENAAAFKAAMQGVLLVYELDTPTTETAQPYHSTQWVSDWGTEEFVSTGIVPVGHETRYPANLRDKLQHLPDAASSNGSYLITQTDGQMTLTPFPAPPTTAGKYVLRATVTNGVATFTWEATT